MDTADELGLPLEQSAFKSFEYGLVLYVAENVRVESHMP